MKSIACAITCIFLWSGSAVCSELPKLNTGYAPSIEMNYGVCTSTAGRPVIAGRNGIVRFIGATLEEDSLDRIPTLSDIVSIEPVSDGYIALTRDHQIFRNTLGGSWHLVYSRTHKAKVVLSSSVYAAYDNGLLTVYANEDDRIIYTEQIGSVLTALHSGLSNRVCLGFSDGAIKIVDNDGSEVFSGRVGTDSIQTVSIDVAGNMVVSTNNVTWTTSISGGVFSKFIPSALLEIDTEGSIKRVLFTRECKVLDTVFSFVEAYDEAGRKRYGAVLFRHIGSSVNELKISMLGPQLDVSSSVGVISIDSLYRSTGEHRVYAIHIRLPNNSFATSYRDFPRRTTLTFGPPIAAADGSIVWTHSQTDVATQATVPSIDSIVRLTPGVGAKLEDVVQINRRLSASLMGVFESEASSVYAYRNFDTVVYIDKASQDRSFHKGWMPDRIWQSANQLVGMTKFAVYISNNQGLTWTKADLPIENYADCVFLGQDTIAVLSTDGFTQSKIYLSPNRGESWSSTSFDGVWTIMAQGSDGSLLILPKQIGTEPDRVNLRILRFDPRTLNSTLVVDTTLSSQGAISGAARLGKGLIVLNTGSAGALYVSDDFKTVNFIDTTTRFTSAGVADGRVIDSNNVVFVSQTGWHAQFTIGTATSVHDNLQRVHVSKIWPMPATNSMRFSVLIPFNEDVHQTTAGIYDVTGRQMMDLTPLLRSGTRTEGTMEFETPLNELQSGAYLFVAKVRGRAVSKNIIVSR